MGQIWSSVATCDFCTDRSDQNFKDKLFRSPDAQRRKLLSSPEAQFMGRSRSGSTYQRSPQAGRWLDRLESQTLSPSMKGNRLIVGSPQKTVLSVGQQPKIVVIVDPISTGCVMAQRLCAAGVKLVRVWSDMAPDEIRKFVPKGGESVRWISTIAHMPGCVEDTVAKLKGLRLSVDFVIVGCETGVTLGDHICERLNVRGNGAAQTALRRNKFLQTEQVRATGLDAAKQKLALTVDDVHAFLEWHNPDPFAAVVKPTEGAGTDGVTFCNSPQQVLEAFQSIAGVVNIFGQDNVGALLQEFLMGDEYVVDTVSIDGVHKCVAMWRYDKRPCNGSRFVYFGMEFLEFNSLPHLPAMFKYVSGVLDALGIQNGAMHSEVMLTQRGPVLVEVNCRMHGGEGTWVPMAEACVGYSQVSALMDSYLDPSYHKSLPQAPHGFKKYAREAKLRSVVEGILVKVDWDAIEQIRKLPSYSDDFIPVKEGQFLAKTVDAVTACGNINLVHSSKQQLLEDYDTLHKIVEKGLFTVQA